MNKIEINKLKILFILSCSLENVCNICIIEDYFEDKTNFLKQIMKNVKTMYDFKVQEIFYTALKDSGIEKIKDISKITQEQNIRIIETLKNMAKKTEQMPQKKHEKKCLEEKKQKIAKMTNILNNYKINMQKNPSLNITLWNNVLKILKDIINETKTNTFVNKNLNDNTEIQRKYCQLQETLEQIEQQEIKKNIPVQKQNPVIETISTHEIQKEPRILTQTIKSNINIPVQKQNPVIETISTHEIQKEPRILTQTIESNINIPVQKQNPVIETISTQEIQKEQQEIQKNPEKILIYIYFIGILMIIIIIIIIIMIVHYYKQSKKVLENINTKANIEEDI
jgi:ABC-type antimicrobial peptide transport system permease subunit